MTVAIIMIPTTGLADDNTSNIPFFWILPFQNPDISAHPVRLYPDEHPDAPARYFFGQIFPVTKAITLKETTPILVQEPEALYHGN